MPRQYLCGACSSGHPENCSGWCGVPEPEIRLGPIQPHVWKELKELGCFVDPWPQQSKPTALYRIVNIKTFQSYFGISVDPARRWKTHRKRARQGQTSRLYNSMREHGIEFFAYSVVKVFPSHAQAQCAEWNLIEYGLAELNMGKR
jgi:hypothetical protein